MRPRPLMFALIAAMMLPLTFTSAAVAVDDAHQAKADKTIKQAVEYLRKAQNEDGSWSPKAGPAITAMVVAGIVQNGAAELDDPMVQKGLKYILSRQKPDGGIYDEILGNYNTSIALMALGPIRDTDPSIASAVKKAQDYVRELQWDREDKDPDGNTIDKGHRWFGGQGYGGSGRPDLSNTATMIAGLRDSGLDCEDPAYVRAMTFITRLQATDANTQFKDDIEPGGGFIYAPSKNKDSINTLETKSDTYEDAEGRSRLRTYGSMTYAGFMSYLYAQLDRDDPRVQDAAKWLRHNYTLDHNPGVGHQGYYYYMHMMARGLDAWTRGEPRGVGVEPSDTFELADGTKINWAHNLIDKLASLQKPDGSFVNDEASRWAEDDANLVTAYALLALKHAKR